MEHNFYDLEDKINIIYDYLYNLNTKNCFSVDKINLGKISIDDIKILKPENSKEDLEIYNKNKEDIINARFKLLNYDDDNKQIILKRYSNQFPTNVKINFYQYNDKNLSNFNSHVNNDSLFSYLLSQLVLNKKTQHILLPIMNIDIAFTDIENIIKNDPSYSKIKSALNNNEISNDCCLQLREHFFKTVSLENYLSQHICSYKGLIFQVIHTLAVLQKEYSGFRHNNLVLKNIIVYLKNTTNSYTEYDAFSKNPDEKYYLPNYGFDIKITNFENAIIPKFYGDFNTKNKNIKFADQPNAYYDIYVFLNDLLEGVTKMSTYSDDNNCDKDTKKFLDKVIPSHIRGLNMDNFNKNIVIVSPIDLLKDAYFEEFKNKPSKKSTEETITNHNYLTGIKSINTFMDSDNYSILGHQDNIISKDNIMHNSKENKIKSKKITSHKIFDDFIEENITIDSNTQTFKNISNINSNMRTLKDNYDIDIKLNRKLVNGIQVNKLKGGGDKPELAPYKNEKNTPFISNEERDINKKRFAENPIREQPVLLEQKIYDTSQKPSTKPQFPPSFIPLYDQSGDTMNQLLPYSKVINQPPVQKVYNISLTNPLANHTSINRIYEDILPGNPNTLTAKTLYERKQLVDFLRNTILQSGDGEEMNITGGKNSLLSYIKIMNVNPYTLNKNPYTDLPRNFLLYRAGYPVRFDDKNNLIGMGKQSMGINIRIYMMSLGDLRCKTINNLINANNFDLWREIKYYDWVKDEIIKRKISPNFISPILYKFDSESKINWSQLELLKSNSIINNNINELKNNDQKINNLHNLNKNLGLFQSLLPLQFRTQNISNTSNTINTSNTNKTNNVNKINNDKEDLTINSGKTLILLTEAPTSSLPQWSTTIYESFGSVKKMISTGHHTADVWKSILFQLVYSMAILQEKGIYIKNFSLENNIYIKDIFSDPNAIGSWIYKVNNIEYYIPNFGYILMIDSKFTDVQSEELIELDKSKSTDNKKYKIVGSLYDINDIDVLLLKNLINYQFKELIHPDNFTHKFKVKGGSIPDDSIINLLKSINADTISNIKDLIPKYFGDFVHNRVGTLLLKSEKENIFTFSKPNFNKGNLMVWQKRYNEYEWVIYIDNVKGNDLKKSILTKKNSGYEIIEVFLSSLYGYPENEKILPETIKNMKYDETHIYETYNFDNLTPV